jgi:hypothetical protein
VGAGSDVARGPRGCVQRRPREEHPVGSLARKLQHRREQTGQVDRDLATHRREPEVEALDRDDAPPVRDGAVAKKGPHDLDHITEARGRRDERHAMLRLHLLAMARAEPEDQAARGEMVDGGGRHRDRGRAPDEDAGDGGPQPDATRCRRARAEDGELVARVSLGHPG